MPPEPAAGSAEDWLARAVGKLLLARQPLPEGGYWEDLCFMAQQAAELAIKAVYWHMELRPAFVHDLGHLLDGLEEKGLNIPDAVREAAKLSVYATHLRYPGTSGFVTQENHQDVLATAETVVAWARGRLGHSAGD